MIYRRCQQTTYNISFSKRLLVLDLPRYRVTTFTHSFFPPLISFVLLIHFSSYTHTTIIYTYYISSCSTFVYFWSIQIALFLHSIFFFHSQQYNSHHFLSIFLIFKIIKTSLYPLIYSLSYFIISYNLELSDLHLHIHQNFERIFLRIEKR